MNHRMQELYGLADKFAKENRVQSIGAPGNNYFELFHEKFAQLIVAECAEIADTERPNSVGCGYITKTNGMRIKEHFGVEQ